MGASGWRVSKIQSEFKGDLIVSKISRAAPIKKIESLSCRLLATTALAAVVMTAPALAQDTEINGTDFSNTNAAAIDVSLLTGDITIDVNSVSTTGDDAPGLDLVTDDGDIYGEVTGSVLTNGENSTGLIAHARGNVTFTIGGDIAAVGDYAGGVVSSSSNGDIDFLVFGSVLTSGQSASAFSLFAENGDITVSAESIQTLGNASAGIDAVALDGNVFATTSGIITTGDFSTAASLSGNRITFTDDGIIATSGDYSAGIEAFGRDVSIEFSELSTAGDFSPALGAFVDGGTLTVRGGNIATTGDHSPGVDLEARSGSISLVLDGVETSGFDSGGVGIRALNSDIAAIIESIEVLGDAADAAFAVFSDGGATLVEIEEITTLGFGVSGIDIFYEIAGFAPPQTPLKVESTSAAVGEVRHADILINAGRILTAGDEAFGIKIEIDPSDGGSLDSGDISIIADHITTEGVGADGIRLVDREGDGVVSISVDEVITSGDDSYGVVASVGSSAIDFVAASTVETLGDDSDAIRLVSLGNINVFADEVLTLGDRSDGVYITNRWVAGEADDPRYVNIVSENVSTAGDNATGIHAVAYSAHVDIRATDVSTLGSQSHAIRASTRSGDITIRASGLIETNGNYVDAISAWSDTGNIDVIVRDVTASGDRAIGVAATTDEGGDIKIVTLGDISVSGQNGNGIGAFAWSGALGASDFGYGDVAINVFGRVSVTGEAENTFDDWEVYGNGIVVHANNSNVTIGEDAHVESTNGYAFLSLDISEARGIPNPLREASDRLNLLGSIAGDVAFGRGDDTFAIFQGADISGLGHTNGGADNDLLQFSGWSGTVTASQFENFEEFVASEGAEVRLQGDWSFDTIEIADSHLLLGNGASLSGEISVFDFVRRSTISFFDTGASASRVDGSIFAPDGIGLNLSDGAGDDAATITGTLDGTAYVNMDVGIGGGQVIEADSLSIGGVNDEIILYLNPYAADGGGLAGPLLNISGGVGDVVLAGGPLVWGGQVFDLSVDGASTGQSNKTIASAAGGGASATVSLATLGFTPEGASTVALPAIIDALDAGTYINRASRLGGAGIGSREAIWGDARYDSFEGLIDGVDFDGQQRALTIGVDLITDGDIYGSLMLRSAESDIDLVQDQIGVSRMEVDTIALGATLGWSASDSDHYAEFSLWGTDRDIELSNMTLNSDGVIASFETGTLFDVSERTRMQPLVQVVWTEAEIDGFTDTVTGGDMQSGDATSMRIRGGAVLTHDLGANWAAEITAIADFNGRDGGETVLASGYREAADLAGMGGELGVRVTGDAGGWRVFGDVTARTAGGDEGSDSLGARFGVARRF